MARWAWENYARESYSVAEPPARLEVTLLLLEILEGVVHLILG